jgi:CheY-like chemotaxis protein
MSGTRRLLVCDDEADFCFYVRKAAEALGYEVREVTDSTRCCAAIAEFSPDVVLLDIVMPRLDGIEIVQRLTQIGYDGRMIIVTGYNPDYARLASVLAAAQGLRVQTLAKPLPLERLRTALGQSEAA